MQFHFITIPPPPRATLMVITHGTVLDLLPIPSQNMTSRISQAAPVAVFPYGKVGGSTVNSLEPTMS